MGGFSVDEGLLDELVGSDAEVAVEFFSESVGLSVVEKDDVGCSDGFDFDDMGVLFVLEVVDLFEEVRDGGVLGECSFVVASESVHFVVLRQSQGVMLSGGHLDNVLVL